MVAYEYAWITRSFDPPSIQTSLGALCPEAGKESDDAVRNALNDAGKDGWELAGVEERPSDWVDGSAAANKRLHPADREPPKPPKPPVSVYWLKRPIS